VKTSSVQKVFVQGDLASTGNQLDVAIEGDGFFQVSLPDGTTAYTRAGNFQLSSEGQIVTPDGYPLNPTVSVDPTAVSIQIAQDGTVSQRLPGQVDLQEAGRIEGARFPNPAGLRAVGRNLFQETTASGNATTSAFDQEGMGRLSQGFLESSNVSIVEQVVNMITGQRAYEASSKGIQTADEMLNQAINLKR
jgi:flagellar basal-body rod protein FlgG